MRSILGSKLLDNLLYVEANGRVYVCWRKEEVTDEFEIGEYGCGVMYVYV